MKVRRGWPATMLLAWTLGTGCTTLREIPPADYLERVPQRPVRVITREGMSFELDTASIEGDSLVGYRRKDVEGTIDEYFTLRLPLDQVKTISARRIDWYRTGLAGGIGVAAVIVAGLGRNGSGDGTPALPCDPGDPDCKGDR